jgi:autotransporter-associated beta strand protein
MKPSRVSSLLACTSGVMALSSATLSAQTWVAGSTDWGATTSWSTGAVPTILNTASFASNTTASTPHTANLNGARQIRGIITTNAGTTSSLNVFGGNGNQTLGIGAGGLTHNRAAMVIGSTTEGQKVNISLLDSQAWTSSAQAGGSGAAAINVYNDISAAVNSTLTLTGFNTGSTIHGPISDGAGILSLTKSSTSGGNGPIEATWTINGPVSYSGPTRVEMGKLRLNSTANLNTSSITMGANTELTLAAGGTTGMPSVKLAGLIATGTFPGNSTLIINTGGPIFLPTTTGVLGNLTKSGATELALAGISSRTTPTAISGGILRIRDLQSGGVPSSIGASTSEPTNFRFASGTRLIYDGPATTSDRLLNLAGTVSIEAAGSGPLQLTNPGMHPGNTGARTIVLLGSNRDDNHIAGMVGDSTRVDSSITKRGNGSWRISGNQPVATTATYRVEEGKLTFDFSTGNDPFSPGTLLVNGGQTVLRGNGVLTSKTVPTLNGGTTIVSGSHLKLENGFALTAGTLTNNGQTQRNDLIDLYDPVGNSNNTLTVNGLGGTLGPINGVLMVNATNNAARANMVIRAQDGSYGFLALSNGNTGTAQKAGPLITPSGGALAMSNAAGNYLLNAGTYTATEHVRFNTLHFNSNNGAVTLNIGNGLKLQPSAQGKAMLFTGNNDITIAGDVDDNDAAEDNATWFHNYLPPNKKLNLNVGLGNKLGTTTIFGGTGTTDYTGRGFVGFFVLTGGKFRVTTDQSVGMGDQSPTIKIGSGATFEIGARFHPEFDHPADFVKPVSSEAGGIRLYGDAGLSAYHTVPGSKRTVYFSNVTVKPSGDVVLTPQQLKWGATYFLTVSESENNTDGDNTFVLSSSTSNAMLEIQNDIDLNGRSRTVEVLNGTAPIDARLSGFLTGDSAAGIVKRGAGTLQLTGVNSYKGETRVMEGTLMIDGATLDPQSRISVDSGATLHIDPASVGANAVHVSSVFINGVEYFGTINHPSITGGGTLISDSPLTPYAQWVNNKSLGAGESAPTYDADFDGIRNLVEYAVGSEPKSPTGSVLTITSGSPRQIKFSHASGRTDIAIFLEASPTMGAPWTPIATSTNGNPFISSEENVTTTEISNQVTVTDDRTPAETKMFYRLRVEK